MDLSGPDSLTSWMIAASCCFINMMLNGIAMASGVIFVATVPRFGVSREMASFPYTFASVVRNITGPLVGYLGNRFGVRAVTSFGCFLSAVGIGACYFAENINTVIVLWGVIYGIGYGLGTILLPVSINQYFDKHRATASGISYSGACLGSFFLPPIFEVLLNTYELSGTFFFISGFVLNCVPVALLLRKPNFEIRIIQNAADTKNGERQNTVSDINVLFTDETKSQNSQGNESTKKHFRFSVKAGIEDNSREGDTIVSSKKIIFTRNTKIDQTNFCYRKDLNPSNTENFTDGSFVEEPVRNKSNISNRNFTSVISREKLDEIPAREKKVSSCLRSFHVFLDPIFIITSVTKAIYTLTIVCTFTIIVDFARDLNIGQTNEKYVLMTVSVSDLIGRLGLVWVTDGGYMTVTGFTALLYALQGVSIAAISWSDGFITLMITGTVYGLTKSGILALFPIIIGQYIDRDKQTVAIASMHLLAGPALMAIPPLIGYFRDHLGSYEYLFYLNAILSLMCSLAWMFAPCIARCQKSR